MKIKVDESFGRGNATCPYCHDTFEASAQRDTCGHCTTVYHKDCVEELQEQCAIFGCRGVFGELVVSSKELEQAGDDTKIELPEVDSSLLLLALGFLLASLSYFVPYLDDLATLVFVIAGAILAYGNSIQAFALLTSKNAHDAKFQPSSYEGSIISLRGIPDFEDALQAPEGQEVIWYESKVETLQVSKARPNRTSMRTSHEEQHCIPFRLGEVTVSNQPTEVYSRHMSEKPVIAGKSIRTTNFIVPGRELLVTGRLVRKPGGFLLEADERVGLLFSAWSFRVSACLEASKAFFGLLLILCSIYYVARNL